MSFYVDHYIDPIIHILHGKGMSIEGVVRKENGVVNPCVRRCFCSEKKDLKDI